MKKIILLFLLSLTACQKTLEKNRNSNFQIALARQAEQKELIERIKMRQIPLVQEEEDKPTITQLKTQENNFQLKALPTPVERDPLIVSSISKTSPAIQNITQKIAAPQEAVSRTGSFQMLKSAQNKTLVQPAILPHSTIGNRGTLEAPKLVALQTVNTSQRDKEIILRFPTNKDALTAFEETRLKSFLSEFINAKKINILIGADDNRKGFEMLKAAADRSRHIKDFIGGQIIVVDIFSPDLEANTIKIEVLN